MITTLVKFVRIYIKCKYRLYCFYTSLSNRLFKRNLYNKYCIDPRLRSYCRECWSMLSMNNVPSAQDGCADKTIFEKGFVVTDIALLLKRSNPNLNLLNANFALYFGFSFRNYKHIRFHVNKEIKHLPSLEPNNEILLSMLFSLKFLLGYLGISLHCNPCNLSF
ncbi:uncharacterized protein LOC119632336 [Glossina fuscipes]|uniref:Uncharacterized protein LOC119632336 n=1 Tax=Glossina fuscipes TaxID=7396 RepID=A0A8U0W7V2_9MUSC|nr:uncharacterized protein LOC119632336 [Glossina fuscipes]KAI9589795.1 hypothetical protein GQX74_007963 [Glossina fuscipes]